MAENFEPLQEQHLKTLHETQGRIDQWQRFVQDYDALHSRLQTLPDNISYDVMVPFGTKAFFHGQLVHTNEVSVLLGDNWFVERSARQAQAIIERRQAHLKGMIGDSEKVLSDIRQRLDVTSAFSAAQEEDIREIHEEFKEEEEATSKELPKQGVDRSSVQSSIDREQPVSPQPSTSPSAPQSRRIAHKPKEIGGRVAQPPRRAFPSSKTHPSEEKACSPARSSTSSKEASDTQKAKPSFEELLARLEKAEQSEAVPVAKPAMSSSAATQTVNFEHSPEGAENMAKGLQRSALAETVSTPGDIYNQFLDEQLQRKMQGQPSLLDNNEAGEGKGTSPSDTLAVGVNAQDMSRVRVKVCEDDDDDDDICGAVEPCKSPADEPGNGNPLKSSLKKIRKTSSGSRVHFNEEPNVKVFDKKETPGPATPPGVTKVESVVGTVKERPMAKVSAIASQVIDAGASDSALPASPIADKTAAQTAANDGTSAKPSTRPQSKFKAARRAADN